MCETTSQLDSLYGRIINKPKLKPPGVQDQTPSQIPWARLFKSKATHTGPNMKHRPVHLPVLDVKEVSRHSARAVHLRSHWPHSNFQQAEAAPAATSFRLTKASRELPGSRVTQRGTMWTAYFQNSEIKGLCCNRCLQAPARKGGSWRTAHLYAQDISDCKFLTPTMPQAPGTSWAPLSPFAVHMWFRPAWHFCFLPGLSTAQMKESRAQTQTLGLSR